MATSVLVFIMNKVVKIINIKNNKNGVIINTVIKINTPCKRKFYTYRLIFDLNKNSKNIMHKISVTIYAIQKRGGQSTKFPFL